MGGDSARVRGLRRAAAAAACALLSACASLDFEPPAVPPLEGLPRYDIETLDPLELSHEMKQFVAAHLGERDDPDRAWRMAWILLDPWVFPFEYDPRVTLTAREAFRTRRGNCLSFSYLFVAMAREAGLEAWFREVEIPPEWSSVDDTLLVSMHVNAGVRERGRSWVVDVSRRADRPGERVRVLGDREATAQLYNNLGADALVAGDLALAHAWFRKAVETDRRGAYVWSNLGVTLRRNGQVADAMRAYETALRLDPDSSVALNNLYTIYEEEGLLEQAAAVQDRVERIRRRNPYYLHHLAELAAIAHDWPGAIDYSRRAIRIKDDEYRFHYLLAQAQHRAGDAGAATAALAAAHDLAPPSVDRDGLVLPGELPLPYED